MSEPTYRVDLSHHPEDGANIRWRADVVRLSDESLRVVKHGDSRENAFTYALQWVVAQRESQHSSSVYLSEDGDLLDPHEVQR